MSDARLRELERRWRETGSVEDEAAYLRERVRTGGLTQDQLKLAAYCGHPGARRAVSAIAPPAEPVGWVAGLALHGDSIVLATAAFAAFCECQFLLRTSKAARGLIHAISRLVESPNLKCADGVELSLANYSDSHPEAISFLGEHVQQWTPELHASRSLYQCALAGIASLQSRPAARYAEASVRHSVLASGTPETVLNTMQSRVLARTAMGFLGQHRFPA